MGILLGGSTATAVCERPVAYCSASMLCDLLLKVQLPRKHLFSFLRTHQNSFYAKEKKKKKENKKRAEN